MRISDWSSDVCSSDLRRIGAAHRRLRERPAAQGVPERQRAGDQQQAGKEERDKAEQRPRHAVGRRLHDRSERSEEHTSELQSLMRISYAVFCLKKIKRKTYRISAAERERAYSCTAITNHQ